MMMMMNHRRRTHQNGIGVPLTRNKTTSTSSGGHSRYHHYDGHNSSRCRVVKLNHVVLCFTLVLALAHLWVNVSLQQQDPMTTRNGGTVASSSSLATSSQPQRGVRSVAREEREEQIQHDTTTNNNNEQQDRNQAAQPQRHTASSLSLSSSSSTERLPAWIRNYLQWHQQMRAQFPGAELFNNPDAPKLMIRTCLGICGGINDRLGQLPWDLYLANQTNRVLLLHWVRPVPLQHFLIPNELDWTVPREIKGFYPDNGQRVVKREGMQILRSHTDLFEGYESDRPEPIFWQTQLDAALQRATTGEFRDHKILRHRMLGHLNEDVLEQRLRDLGETDMLHWTPSFGQIFWMFFRVAPAIQKELDNIYHELDLTPGQYSAVHCRVRHPKATAKTVHVKGKNEDYPADKSGLPWYGETRAFAIETATHALRCAETLLDKQPQTLSSAVDNSHKHNEDNEPIYFFSDSNDLVHYMAHELADPQFVANTTLFATSPADAAALAVVNAGGQQQHQSQDKKQHQIRVVARNASLENAHIDKQKGREPHEYYSTFVDMILAINARCVTFGIGYYAMFAVKVSGTSCSLLYQEEAWGGTETKGKTFDRCPIKVEHAQLN